MNFINKILALFSDDRAIEFVIEKINMEIIEVGEIKSIIIKPDKELNVEIEGVLGTDDERINLKIYLRNVTFGKSSQYIKFSDFVIKPFWLNVLLLKFFFEEKIVNLDGKINSKEYRRLVNFFSKFIIQ